MLCILTKKLLKKMNKATLEWTHEMNKILINTTNITNYV